MPTLLPLEASFPSMSLGLVPPLQGFCEVGGARLASGCSQLLHRAKGVRDSSWPVPV